MKNRKSSVSVRVDFETHILLNQVADRTNTSIRDLIHEAVNKMHGNPSAYEKANVRDTISIDQLIQLIGRGKVIAALARTDPKPDNPKLDKPETPDWI